MITEIEQMADGRWKYSIRVVGESPFQVGYVATEALASKFAQAYAEIERGRRLALARLERLRSDNLRAYGAAR